MSEPTRHTRWLKEQIDIWVEENIITTEQKTLLAERYELDKPGPWYTRSGFIIQAIAVLLAALALLLIISANWHRFPTALRMLMGLLPLAAAYAYGIYTEQNGNRDRAELAFHFANIAFGANIFLQAQIFHISAYYPNGILWWIIGVVPIALYFKSHVQHGLLQGLYAMWLSMQLDYSQFSLWSPLILAVLCYHVYHHPNRILLVATIINFILALFNLLGYVDRFYEPQYVEIMLGAGLLIILLLHFFEGNYRKPFLEKVSAVFLVLLFFLFFLQTFEGLSSEVLSGKVAVGGGLMLALAGVLYSRQTKTMPLNILFVFVSFILIANALIALSPESGDKIRTTGWVLFNLGFLASAILMIWNGISHQEKRYFMAGIFMIAALALLRYLTLFGDYLTTAFIFILCSIGLYFANNYWNKRYEL